MHIARTPSVQCACTAPRSSARHLFNMENDWARSSLHLNKYMIPAFAFCNFGKWRTFGGSGGVGSGTILMLPTIIKYINTNKHHHITQKHTERERQSVPLTLGSSSAQNEILLIACAFQNGFFFRCVENLIRRKMDFYEEKTPIVHFFLPSSGDPGKCGRSFFFSVTIHARHGAMEPANII